MQLLFYGNCIFFQPDIKRVQWPSGANYKPAKKKQKIMPHHDDCYNPRRPRTLYDYYQEQKGFSIFFF